MKTFFELYDIIKQIPKTQQIYNYDCGAAALYAICKYYQIGPKNYKEVIKDCKSDKKNGTSHKILIQTAEKYGLYTSQIHNMTLKELEEILDDNKLIIIAMQAYGDEKNYKKLNSGHYVVVIGYDKKNIYFEDPSIHDKKRGFIPKKEFLKRWKDKTPKNELLNKYGIIIWKNNKKQKTNNITSIKKIK